MLLYPLLRIPHTCYACPAVTCGMRLWAWCAQVASAGSSVCRCDCRSSCSSTPPVQRCQGSCVECKTHKLASCIILPRCPTPSSSLTMTNSYGLDICPSGDVLSYWRVVHTASQGYPGGLKQACRTAPLIPVPVPDRLRLHFYIVTSIYVVFSATALLPNSISPLLLPLLKSIGFLMLHKLIVSQFRLPCHSSFCLFSLWTGRVFLLEGVKEWPVREPVYSTAYTKPWLLHSSLLITHWSALLVLQNRRMSFPPYCTPCCWCGHWGTWISWCAPCHLKSHFQLCGWKSGLPAQTSATPVTHCSME